MKCALFNKNGYGALTGRLTAPNRIVYRDSDGNGGETLKEALLTGNVVDTEYNDVVVVGKKISDFEIQVTRMESLPKNGEMFLLTTGTENEKVSCLIAAGTRLQSVTDKINSNGKPYKDYQLDGGKNTFVHVNAFGISDEEAENLVFVGQGVFSSIENVYGQGYAQKKVVNRYSPNSFQVGV